MLQNMKGGEKTKNHSIWGLHSRRVIVGEFLAVLLLAAFFAVPQAFAQAPQSGAYVNISVAEAYKMIKEAPTSLVILDVRNQSEYNLGNLYNAILIPVYELEDNISELQGHINDPIIVYCKSGYRSQIASEILVSNGFTKVYNMLGGILAWIEAGYSIYTTYHYVIVDTVNEDEEVLTRIEPLLLHQSGGSCGCSCGCSSCTPTSSVSAEFVNSTTVRQENVVRSTYTLIVNGTEIEITALTSVIANETFIDKDQNKTLSFTYTQVSNSLGFSTSYYRLMYNVETTEYYFRTETTLTPLQNSEGYNSSSTHITFATKDQTSVQTLELAKFSSSVALSQLYNALSYVAKDLRKLYHSQGLEDIAGNYHEIAKNLNELSGVISKQLEQYNSIIVESRAIIEDARIAVCSFGLPGAALIFYCLNPLYPAWVISGACCAALYAIVLTVIGVCAVSLGTACLIALLVAIVAGWASLAGCYQTCPSMEACINMCFLWWCWDVVCMQMW